MAANGMVTSVQSKGGRYSALWIVEGVLLLFWLGMVLRMSVFAVAAYHLVVLWGLGILIMVILLGLAGREIKGRWTGALIDSRNKFSLSRLQMTLWTIMVLSAYLAVAMPRVLAMLGSNPTLSQEQALNIQFPEELLFAMGISAASFAGADLIKNTKKNKTLQIAAKPDLEKLMKGLETAANELFAADAKRQFFAQDKTKSPKDLERVEKEREAKKKALEIAEAQLSEFKEEKGVLHMNPDASEAKWVDLLHGEDMGNHEYLDLSKVQMLFLTVVVIAAYAAAISGMLLNTETLRTLPSLSFPDFAASLNTLLVISHGTYLSVKTVPHG